MTQTATAFVIALAFQALLAVVVLVLAVHAVRRWCAEGGDGYAVASNPYAAGETLGEVTAQDASGTRCDIVQLVRRAGGGVLLFASPESAACRAVLARVRDRRPPVGLVVVLPDRFRVRRWAGARRFAATICFDRFGVLFEHFGVRSVPFALVLDRRGTVVSVLK